MGNRFEKVTKAINLDSSIRLGQLAAEAGVRNFIFASSCSVYGVAKGGARQEHDPLNPMTAYAASKIGTEEGLSAIETDMTITCLRRSEEHTSELQSLMRISYAVFCLKKKK